MTCSRCWLCGAASCLVKVTHKKLWETTLNRGEEEYGCFYLTYVWISLIWSKKDIFSSESRRFSWLLKVEVCICLQHVVSLQLQIGLQWRRTETRKCFWIWKFGNIGFTFDWLRKWCQFRQPMTKCWTYQSSKHIIICSHILWDKWRACLQTNVHWKA